MHTSTDTLPATRTNIASAHPFRDHESQLTITVKRALPKATQVYESFWQFACERQNVFHQRRLGRPAPWTNDRVLLLYKFTNAYRASDRVSQYLIRNVIYDERSAQRPTRDVFFRILLFKMFNRIETWQLLEAAFGDVTAEGFDLQTYDRVLTTAQDRGHKLYTAAYMTPADRGGEKTHRMNLRVLNHMMTDRLDENLAAEDSMSTCFNLLRAYHRIGDFLAYQYLIDLNYSDMLSFSEDDFVKPGPGCDRGIAKCFPSMDGWTSEDMISFVTENQEIEFARRGLEFRDLFGRRLHKIDIQNLFCEVDKYARVAHPEIAQGGKVRPKHKFAPTPTPIVYFYPPKWAINDRL